MFKQITVFLENKPGRVYEVTGCLAAEQINLYALSIADTENFGILRLILSDPEKAEKVLKENGFMVKVTDVIAVAMEHKPGGLHNVLKKLKELDISIEYMYTFTSYQKDYGAVVILRLDNQDSLFEALKNSGINVLGQEFIDSLSN